MFATGITFNYGHILPFPSGFALQLTTSCILTILPLRVCGWEVEPARGVIIDISSWNNCFERPERERGRERRRRTEDSPVCMLGLDADDHGLASHVAVRQEGVAVNQLHVERGTRLML